MLCIFQLDYHFVLLALVIETLVLTIESLVPHAATAVNSTIVLPRAMLGLVAA